MLQPLQPPSFLPVHLPQSLRGALQGASGVIFAASGMGYWSAKGVDYQVSSNVYMWWFCRNEAVLCRNAWVEHWSTRHAVPRAALPCCFSGKCQLCNVVVSAARRGYHGACALEGTGQR